MSGIKKEEKKWGLTEGWKEEKEDRRLDGRKKKTKKKEKEKALQEK